MDREIIAERSGCIGGGLSASTLGITLAKVVSGKYYEYLKEIKLVGRKCKNAYIIHGCVDEHQEYFYEALMKIDKENQVIGFESIEEIKDYWECGGDMLFTLDINDIEIIKGGAE